MGMQEKRATSEFQANDFPGLQARINELAGHRVSIEVEWNELAEPDYGHMYKEGWTKIFFTPLVDALVQLTRDVIGKDAVRHGLRAIRLRSSGYNSVVLADGTLTIDQRFSNFNSIDERTTAVLRALEAGL